MPTKSIASLALAAVLSLEACFGERDVIARAEIRLAGSELDWFSYAPTNDRETNVKSPTCSWNAQRGDVRFSGGSGRSLEVFRLACSFFDQPNADFQDKMLRLLIQFQRLEGQDHFSLEKGMLTWSRNGLLLRSTLHEGRFDTPCLAPNCGFVIHDLSFPDPGNQAGELRFDLSLDHNLSGNLDRDGEFKAAFRFHGKALFRKPR